MKKKMNVWLTLLLMVLTVWACRCTAYAVTESEVQAQVNAHGSAAVSGNVFVWFLCAIAFLKVSQKIDSFLNAIGVNVGQTGGSMLAEVMIAVRGVNMAKGLSGASRGGASSSGSAPGSNVGGAAPLSGGLAGVVSRSVTGGAVRSAVGAGSGGIGGAAYRSSVGHGGSFANSVIGQVATGSIAANGSISGQGAEDALMSYMGYAAMESEAENIPHYSNVEIGGGRITATETSDEHPDGIGIGMYHAGQYSAPIGEYTTVTAADGTSWYKQYAANAVQRTPYQAQDNTISYRESLVQKLPDPPRRKDKT